MRKGWEEDEVKIRMYDCKFGDCFRLMEQDEVDLYVDFGIHPFCGAKWRDAQFARIIDDMPDEMDFLLTHYHADHFSGAVYMAKNTNKRFRNVYIPNVWDYSESIDIIMLLLLRGFYSKFTMNQNLTLFDFLWSICKMDSRIYFLSRGVKFRNHQYVTLWPSLDFVSDNTKDIMMKIRTHFQQEDLEQLEKIAEELRNLVRRMREGDYDKEDIIKELNALKWDYTSLTGRMTSSSLSNHYINKLNKLGNDISVVFQNDKDFSEGNMTITFGGSKEYVAGIFNTIRNEYTESSCIGGVQGGLWYLDNKQEDFSKDGEEYQIGLEVVNQRNILFTGDLSENWENIIDNIDKVVEMHSKYHVIKIPHHGTDRTYHYFGDMMTSESVALIPNGGKVRKGWGVSEKYRNDFIQVRNRTVCAGAHCQSPFCPRGMCIHSNLYVDI